MNSPHYSPRIVRVLPGVVSLPILVWDGDCGFCRAWVDYWKKLSGNRMAYAPYQEVADYFPDVSRHEFAEAARLFLPDGEMRSGAHAAYTTLAMVPGKQWLHHAFPDHGEGFNLINDVAVAIRRMQKDGAIKTAMTVDCDVHHGNGTAAIFGRRDVAQSPWPERLPYMRESPAEDVFTISLHQENNYPAWRPASSIDVCLPDGMGDDEYLAWLEKALTSGLRRFQPDLICYLAGSDPYRRDLLGGLALTIEGLKCRDEFVFRTARAQRIPVVALPAGGYASDVRDTVTIHGNTILAAREIVASARRDGVPVETNSATLAA